ncbi:MAG: nucleotidyltransferase domain-containing protein [Gemmatimonadaceae bacterium]
MIQTATGSAQIVDEIVATLISRFNPRRIYLFGSRARGDALPDSDYDFLIEIERTPESSQIRRESRNSLPDFPAADVQLHVRYPDELERRKDDPGTIDWDVVREGKLLWASAGVLPLSFAPSGGRVRESNRTPPDSLAEWLARAEEDLEVALGLPLGERQGDCVLLSRFAVRTRYPDDEDEPGTPEEIRMPEPIRFSEQDARDAIAALNRIAAGIRPLLPVA